MNKTKLFAEVGDLASVREYQTFIKNNPDIEIISVNVLRNDAILLTYIEKQSTMHCR